MRYLKTQGFKLVSAESDKEFEAQMQKELLKLAQQNIQCKIEFNHQLGKHCAYITFDQTQEYAETVKEEYMLHNEFHFCSECRFYEKPSKGNIKNTRCPKTGGLTTCNSQCCEMFYDHIADESWFIDHSEDDQQEELKEKEGM